MLWYSYGKRVVSKIAHIYLPMKMERTECSETSAYKIQTPSNYPEESTKHSEHGEILKSRIAISYLSACPHGTTRLPLIGFLRNLTFGVFCFFKF